MKRTERNSLMEMLNAAKCDIEDKQVVVWGTGNTAKLYQNNIDRLEAEGIKIVYYADSTSSKWGVFQGKQIIDPEEIKGLERVFVIICSMNPANAAEISSLLGEWRIEGAPVDKVILSRYCKEVIECYDILEDAESKRVYAALIKARINVENPPVDIISPDQYYLLPQFCRENENEVLVECGGYTGDTLETYIRKKKGKFGQIISFEPYLDNIEKAKERVAKLIREFELDEDKIKLYPYAVSDRAERVFAECLEVGKENLLQVSSEREEGGKDIEYIDAITLDGFLAEPYSFLKADVEGDEKKVLLGAKNGIKNYKPLLAICIYHSAMDFYEIPILIKEMVPEYNLSVRHHKKTLSETVIYAYLDECDKSKRREYEKR